MLNWHLFEYIYIYKLFFNYKNMNYYILIEVTYVIPIKN